MPKRTTELPEPVRMLVIDDNAQQRHTVVRLLQAAGYAVSAADNGAEGLRLAQTQHPDLVLLDVILPDISGLDVCRRLKALPACVESRIVLRENVALFDRYVRIVETGQGDEVELHYETEGIDGWFRNMAVKLGDGVAISFSDITARKQAEAMLQRQREELERLVQERTAALQVANARLEQELTDRKQAEEALRESEAYYRAIFEYSLNGIFLNELDGSILAANPEACRLLGYTAEELLRLNRSDIVDLTDPRLAAAMSARVRTGKFRGELTYRRRDGARIPVEVASVLFTSPNGEPRTNIFFTDITDRKRTEEALRESEERFRSTFEQAAVGIAHVSPEGRFLRINQRFCVTI